MALSLSSVSPTEVSYDGGRLITFSGTFDLGVRYNAYIGITGSVNDSPCYSGIPGQGNDLFSFDGTTLNAYNPPLWVGGPFIIYVRAPDVPEDATLEDILLYRMASYPTLVFAMRAVLPPIYKTGPRNINNVAPWVP